eukprot:TRINITY_DN5254_c0_g1_i1.p3 TRINITY_DN5254_c0_g1~~TRINITY_DN5254_c0_g1_i1.p3  ORF type:complete len:119 (-),score=29.67 TRINITY_DN5254_c0_g1_i1:877-1233(-)
MKTIFCPSIASSQSILHSTPSKLFPISPLPTPKPTIPGHLLPQLQTAKEFRAACTNSAVTEGQPGDGAREREGGVREGAREGAVESVERKGEVGKSLEESRNSLNSAFVEFSKGLSPP